MRHRTSPVQRLITGFRLSNVVQNSTSINILDLMTPTKVTSVENWKKLVKQNKANLILVFLGINSFHSSRVSSRKTSIINCRGSWISRFPWIWRTFCCFTSYTVPTRLFITCFLLLFFLHYSSRSNARFYRRCTCTVGATSDAISGMP